MTIWTTTKMNKSVIRFAHEQGSFTFDFSRSHTFNLDMPIDTTVHERILQGMRDTEEGKRVNVSENRMVGHFWLRHPELAPTQEMGTAIQEGMDRCKRFSEQIQQGEICGEKGDAFAYLVVIGIGGSQLGFQFVLRALSDEKQNLKVFSLDNTDPDSVDQLIREIGQRNLDKVLYVVASKSGGTTEIRNLYTVLDELYKAKQLSFPKHAVAVTMEGSSMDTFAKEKGWLDCFPVWDWVGGRYSVLSPVGILPLALLGLDVDALLSGAKAMDEITRSAAYPENPAMLLAQYISVQTDKQGKHNMVVLPYKDKLDLWGKYLQQLCMESLGKTMEGPDGAFFNGLTIFGNKGTTDQHSYVQQLLGGFDDYFALFFYVLREKGQIRESIVEEGGITMGDYLLAFCHGTMNAMRDRGRESMLLTLDRLDAFTLGGLIALFERTVGFYAARIGLNPYDQPQVEEGKKSAAGIIETKKKLNAMLAASGFRTIDIETMKGHFAPEEYGMVYYQLLHAREKGILHVELSELDKLLMQGSELN